jgi:hypothetical protein
MLSCRLEAFAASSPRQVARGFAAACTPCEFTFEGACPDRYRVEQQFRVSTAWRHVQVNPMFRWTAGNTGVFN